MRVIELRYFMKDTACCASFIQGVGVAESLVANTCSQDFEAAVCEHPGLTCFAVDEQIARKKLQQIDIRSVVG